jgi:2-polyprenyl-3-methyl-5-hydroxy-6-metoxy-1,4-benzoquinol methylase
VRLPPIRGCDRIQYVLAACEGKEVLHIGCADWPFTREKLESGTLLHTKIDQVSRHAFGVDLSAEGILKMRERGIDGVFVHDATKSLQQQLGMLFDVVVAGETIEHVLNAGDFLESIKTVMRPDSVLVMTTPNFCPIKRTARLLYRSEVVNADHVCYYSRITLGKLMDLTGYEVLDWKAHWWDVGMVSTVANKVLRRIPFMQYYADTLCLTARLRP